MSPRPYTLGQREITAEQTRSRIVSAAHDVLSTADGPAAFSMDLVARRASVARMTVYHQFESKAHLLEAVFDFVASRGQLAGLPAALAQREPLEALAGFIAIFGRFWASDRVVMRHLRGLAVLDDEFGEAVRIRNERRKKGLHVIVRRLHDVYGHPPKKSFDELVDMLHALTNFETYDTLAGPSRTPAHVAPIINRVARAALGFDPDTNNKRGLRRKGSAPRRQ